MKIHKYDEWVAICGIIPESRQKPLRVKNWKYVTCRKCLKKKRRDVLGLEEKP